MEFRPSHSVRHPFLASALAAGSPIGRDDIVWRDVPAGLLTMPDLEGAEAGHDLAAGEPILPSDIAPGWQPPPGWWAVPVRVAAPAPPGSAVRVVVLDELLATDGILLRSPPQDPFSVADVSLVAVPGEHAAGIAAAAARNAVVVLVRP